MGKEYKKLHAEWYELQSAKGDQKKEIEFWLRCIEESGEPVLELGSGTGRIFVPLLEHGVDLVGIDTSSDMTARCIAACEKKGLKPEIYDQSMLDFHLAREFGLVILDSGGLGLFTNDEDIDTVFERVMAHLKPGGLFVFEYEPVPADGGNKTGNNWFGDWVDGPDGVVIAFRRRRKYDPETRIWQMLFILDKFVDGRPVESEANDRTGRYFTLTEVVRHTQKAGFVDIVATDWLTDDPPKKDSVVITVRCRKPVV